MLHSVHHATFNQSCYIQSIMLHSINQSTVAVWEPQQSSQQTMTASAETTNVRLPVWAIQQRSQQMMLGK